MLGVGWRRGSVSKALAVQACALNIAAQHPHETLVCSCQLSTGVAETGGLLKHFQLVVPNPCSSSSENLFLKAQGEISEKAKLERHSLPPPSPPNLNLSLWDPHVGKREPTSVSWLLTSTHISCHTIPPHVHTHGCMFAHGHTIHTYIHAQTHKYINRYI